MAYSGDSKILALASGPSVILHAADGSKQVGSLLHAGPVTALAFRPGTNMLATFTASPNPNQPRRSRCGM